MRLMFSGVLTVRVDIPPMVGSMMMVDRPMTFRVGGTVVGSSMLFEEGRVTISVR